MGIPSVRIKHYERHRPDESLLYRVVKENWSSFRERVEDLGSLPKFVVRELNEYLRCALSLTVRV